MARNQFPQSQDSHDQVSYEIGLKIRDLEESHKLMKERVLLIGQNLIDFQEKAKSEITSIKKDIYEVKSDVKRIKEVVESLSEELSKSARKEELAILIRQSKMFDPLKFARIEDVEKMIEEKVLHKHHHTHEENPNENQDSSSTKHEFWRNKI
ncbi:MAG TPA: hypothetical protein VI815_00870 [Candidatus Nanoarchaeia archaeon]|nr:hypothetical protein [Candidatus Nanoarchaeia archaeon]